MLKEFEIGPIRPPSEAESLLLRITRNCPWNKCKFCKLYKRHHFQTRPFSEIQEDIDQIATYRDDIMRWLSEEGSLTQQKLQKKLAGLTGETSQRYLYVLNWLLGKDRNVFLQDANTMVLSHHKLKEILVYLREKLPEVGRITSYARVDALCRYTEDQLTDLRKAGLDRIHSGYESGSDKVLTLINKGYTKAQEIEGGRKVKQAGIELSVYVMPGVGGKELSHDNALETADVLSQVDPDFVRIRTFVAQRGTELMEDIESGRMTECSDLEKLLELKKMIEHIHGAHGRLYSDHIINLLQEVNGNLTNDKDAMLSKLNAFATLPKNEQKSYQLARRMGMVRSLDEMGLLSQNQMEQVSASLSRFADEQEFEAFLQRYLRKYI